MTTLNRVLIKELESVTELTSFEEGLQYAQLRQLELLLTQYEYFTNPFYNDLEQGLEAPFAMTLESEIQNLALKLAQECEQDEGYVHRAKYFV